MKLFHLIQLLDAQLDPRRCKVHLATHNGVEDPLDVYLAGNFDEWQSWQRKKNFERDFVVAFISLPPPDKWLFAGAYSVHGRRWNPNRKLFHYDMLRRPSCDELGGRLVARFKRSGRMPYLVGENWADQIQVHEIRPEKLHIADFPGYSATSLTKAELDIIVRQGIVSWKSALSNVAGIYLIADTQTGKLYVGSATGDGGIWHRWRQYSLSGHGGNQRFESVVGEKGFGIRSRFPLHDP